MIVLHPDHIPILGYLPNGGSKGHIGTVVGIPLGLIKVNLSRLVVKERPQGAER